MKKLISLVSVFSLIIITIFYFSSNVNANTSNAKAELLKSKNWNELIKKIDNIASKVVEKSNANPDFYKKLNKNLEIVKNKYKKKKGKKAMYVYNVIVYLMEEINSGISSNNKSKIGSRFQRIKANNYKNELEDRINKSKIKSYKRIHLKK